MGYPRLRRLMGTVSSLTMIVGATVLIFALLEGTARIWYLFRAPNAQQPTREVQWEARWSPYLYWTAAPGRYGDKTVGEDGYRVTVQPEASQPACVVTLFGGSTMYGWKVPDHQTVPSYLAQRLFEIGFNVEVRNAGQMGYVSTQELLAFYLKLRNESSRPDVAVFMHGYNDMYSAMQQNVAGITINEYNRARDFNAGHVERDTSAAHRKVIQELGISKGMRGLIRKLSSRDGEFEPTVDVPALASDTVRFYQQNVETIRLLGRRHQVFTQFYWQPSAYDGKPLTATEQGFLMRREKSFPLWVPFHEHVFALLRNTKLRASAGWTDLAHVFQQTPAEVYVDDIHTNAVGNQIIANAIADDLGAKLSHSDVLSDRCTRH